MDRMITNHNILSMLAAMSTDTMMQIFVTVGLFVVVFLLTILIFGQSGEIKLSPQREAALLTGHSDRRTVFEKPALRPFMWMLLVIGHRFAFQRLKDWLHRTLVAAGSPNYYTSEEYLAISMLTGIVTGVCATIVGMFLTEGQLSFFAMFVGFWGGLGLAIYQSTDGSSRSGMTCRTRWT